MTFQIEMPHVGESVTEAVIGKWLKSVGDRIEKYDPIVEVITDKVSMEVPAPASGRLSRIVAQEGETVQMGALIAEMDAEGEITTSSERHAPATLPDQGRIGELIAGANVGPTGGAFTDTSLSSPANVPARTAGPAVGRNTSDPVRYSPVVIRLAAEHGVELSSLAGTGLGGRVTKKDVEAAIRSGSSSPGQAAGTSRLVEPSPIRKMIADHMVKSWREIPHAWSAIEVDASGLSACRNSNRARFKREHGVDLTYLPLALNAVARSLRDHELLNSSWAGGRVRVHSSVNVGIAVAAPNGLVVPVIKAAAGKGVVELAKELADVIGRARDGKLDVKDVQGGTFTLNNTGALGSIWGGAIINHPQAAILTTEAIVKRAVVVGGGEEESIEIRPMMNICLSFDHRIIDGSEAAEFLQDVRGRLEAFRSDTELG